MLKAIAASASLTALLCCTACVPSTRAEAAGTTSNSYQKSYDLEARGEFRAAIEALKQVPPRQRTTYIYALREAWLQYRAADYRAAVASYRRAISLAPKAIEPRVGLMLPQMALRLWKDAADTGRAALERDPLNYLANTRLAFSLYNLGRYKESARFYAKVLELYPGDIEMRAGLGWALIHTGRKKRARSAFAAVLAVAPRHLSAKQGMAALR